MIIVDSNTIIQHLSGGESLLIPDMLVPDDLYEEYIVAELRHNKRIPNIKLASTLANYDQSYYLTEYVKAIRSFKHFSFARMSGFGDIAIIALASSIIDDFGKSNPQQLTFDLVPGPQHQLTVITSDKDLRAYLNDKLKEDIRVIEYADYLKENS